MDSDPGPLWFHFVIALFLVLLNGFFVATEFALLNVTGTRMGTLASKGRWQAKLVLRILKNVNAYLSSCRLGITITSIGLGWLAGPALVNVMEPMLSHFHWPERIMEFIGWMIGFAIVVTSHYIISEHIPKLTAMQKPEQVTLWSAAPIVFFYNLTFPLTWLLNKASNGILHKSGMKSEIEREVAHTEDEIRVLVKESHKSGKIDQTELLLVDNAFEFTETIGREIMIPRTELVCLYANMTFEENLEIATAEMRTRYPVCNPDKDHIIGFIHMKDLLKASVNGLEHIQSIVRPLMSVPETTPISSILKQMQSNRTEIALLIDEYGGTSGLVTIEDILEELVGEIYDEFDEDRPSIEKKDSTTHSIDGLLHIDEFNDYFGLDIQTDDYDTIGGWLYSQLDTLPEINQRVYYGGLELIVDEMMNHRISRIVVKKRNEPQARTFVGRVLEEQG